MRRINTDNRPSAREVTWRPGLGLCVALSALGAAACGDDSGTTLDTSESGLRARFEGRVPMSADQADRFTVAAFADDTRFYAAGFSTQASGDRLDQEMVVARFDLDGKLDPSFGEEGIVRLNLSPLSEDATGDETADAAKGLAVQPDGKVVFAGVVGSADGRKCAVGRLHEDGTLDDGEGGFSVDDGDGVDGVFVIDLGVATEDVDDDVGGVTLDDEGRILLFARAKASSEERVDANRFVLRLSARGELDDGFGEAGMFEGSTEGEFNENAKPGRVLEDGSILSPGYTRIDEKNHIVIFKLDAAGRLARDFADAGSLVFNPFANEEAPTEAGFVEAYGVTVQADGSLITTGYGREEAALPQNRLYSFRFSPDGERDDSFGSEAGFFELAGIEDGVVPGPIQGRNLVALPDDRILEVGNATRDAEEAEGDALVVLLKADGQLDESFHGQGFTTFDFGMARDALYGLALSPDGGAVVAAGYAGAANSDEPALLAQQDAALVIFSLEAP